MSVTLIELNDCGIRVQRDGRQLLESPGFVTVSGRQPWLGEEALARAKLEPTRTEYQFWDKLSTEPLQRPNQLGQSHADLAYRHLEHVWQRVSDDADAVILVVPGDLQREQLALLLGMARKLSIPVRALLNAGVSSSAAPVPGRDLLHLDLHLHRAVLTRLEQGAWLEVDRCLGFRDVGLHRLREAWTQAIADLFVKATRFDPTHQAETEQQVLDALPGWIDALSDQEHLEIDLQHGDRRHAVRLHRRQVLRAAEPQYRRLRGFVAESLAPGRPASLQISHRLAALPGLVQSLGSLSDLEIIPLDPTAIGSGIERLYLRNLGDTPEVPLVEKVPWFNARDLDAHDRGLAGYHRRQPTHVLHQSVAYPLVNGEFAVGTDVSDSAGIRLPTRFPGVEGRHFCLRSGDEGLEIEDLSGGATVVNDEPVSGPVTVAVGDRIRIGNPGTEFQLIAVEKPDGT